MLYQLSYLARTSQCSRAAAASSLAVSGAAHGVGADYDGLLSAPGEVDPAVRPLPDVVGPDHRVRLLAEHRDMHLADLACAEPLHALEPVAGVGDAVRDQDSRAAVYYATVIV